MGQQQSHRKAYASYILFLGGSAFSWKSKHEGSVVLSSTEAEYIALASAAKEAIYLLRLMIDIGIGGSRDPIRVYGDHLSAQQLAKNLVYHSSIKYIDIKYHFVREVINERTIQLKYIRVCTNKMTADVLLYYLSKLKN